MTLEETITYYKNLANSERKDYGLCPVTCSGSPNCRVLKDGEGKGCLKKAEEYEQVATWLTELRDLEEKYRSTLVAYYDLQEEYDLMSEDWEREYEKCKKLLILAVKDIKQGLSSHHSCEICTLIGEDGRCSAHDGTDCEKRCSWRHMKEVQSFIKEEEYETPDDIYFSEHNEAQAEPETEEDLCEGDM